MSNLLLSSYVCSSFDASSAFERTNDMKSVLRICALIAFLSYPNRRNGMHLTNKWKITRPTTKPSGK